MGDPNLVIRVAANLSEMRANIQEGVSQLETWKSAMTAATNAFDGSRVVGQASAAASAIGGLQGVTSLTAAEQEKANRIFTEAAEKLQLMGKGGTEQAQIFRDLAAATKQPAEEGLKLGEVVTDLAVKYVTFEAALDLAKEGLRFVADAIEDASKIEILAQATGVSTEGLQRLGYVGQTVGIDMATLGRAVETFSSKLITGDTSATSAVNRLGLSVKDLIASGPEQAFVSFADAAGTLQDPMDKAAIYTEAFGGRLGRLLIALPDVSEAMRNVPKNAIISDENIKAAHEFDDALEHLKTTAKAYTVEFAGEIYRGNGELAASWHLMQKAFEDAKNALDLWQDKGQATDIVLKNQITHADELKNRLDALRTNALAPLTEEQKANIDALHAGGIELKEIADLVESNTTAVKLYIDAKKEQIKVDKETAEALAKVRAQLAVAGAELYTDDVARARQAADNKYDIAVAEAKKKGIVDQQYYDDLETLRDLDRDKAGINAGDIAKTSQESLNATRDKAAETYDYIILHSEHFRDATVTHFRQVREGAAAAADGIKLDFSQLDSYSLEKMQETYKNAQAMYEYVIENASEYTRAAIDDFRHFRDVALDHLHAIQMGAESTGTAIKKIGDNAETAAAQMAKMAEAQKKAADEAERLKNLGNQATYDLTTQQGLEYFRQQNPGAVFSGQAASDPLKYFATHTLQQAIAAGLVDLYGAYHGGQATHSFAGGVTNFEGGVATVHKDELLVNLPPHTDVIQAAQAGGIGTTLHISIAVAGGVYGDGGMPALVRQVTAEFMRQMRAGGTRFPVTVAT